MSREISIIEMEQIADFYLVDLIDLVDEEVIFKIPETSIHGLRHDEVSKQDFKSIAEFGRIIKNYQKLKNLTKEL